MENKINIAELLKNCPKGMELDCALYNNVTLECVEVGNIEYPIEINIQSGEDTIELTEYGCWDYSDNAKCIIYPKGKTTWEGFVPPVEFKDSGKIHTWTIKDAKDGDIISYGEWTCIFKRIHGIWFSSYCFITSNGDFHTGYKRHAIDSKINGNAHPATKEQCNLLFKKIKEAGYKWNQETKTLEKLIEPRFKVGDKVRVKNGISNNYRIIDGVFDTFYSLQMFDRIDFTEQDRWELVPTLKRVKIQNR